MNCPENTLVLFQYEGRLIGYAVYLKAIAYDKPVELDEDDFYNGYYQFAPGTVTILKIPLTKEDIVSIIYNSS